MPDGTWERIQPIVASRTMAGAWLAVTFRCPDSGHDTESSVPVAEDAGGAAESAPYEAWLRRSLASTLARLLGRPEPPPPWPAVEELLSEQDLRYVTVQSFALVSDQFWWDGDQGRYRGTQLLADLQTEFDLRLARSSMADAADRELLAHMLAEISSKSSGWGEDGRRFFHQLLPGHGRSLDALARSGPLDDSQLGSMSPGARELALMVAYAVAYADHQLDRTEMDRLLEYSRALEVNPPAAARLAAFARQHVMDRILGAYYRSGHISTRSQEEVWQAAGRLGIDAPTLKRLDARCRRRRGIQGATGVGPPPTE